MLRKQKALVFPPSIPWIYWRVEQKVLGIPFAMTSEFLHHFREENLITPEGEYKEEYAFEAIGPSERVCYLNHDSGSRWLWIYNVLITKLGVWIPFTYFQVTIL